jgi:hypothetical protein
LTPSLARAENEFLAESVTCADPDDRWERSFAAAKENPLTMQLDPHAALEARLGEQQIPARRPAAEAEVAGAGPDLVECRANARRCRRDLRRWEAWWFFLARAAHLRVINHVPAKDDDVSGLDPLFGAAARPPRFCSENVGLRESVTTKNPSSLRNYTAELGHGNGGVH